MERPMHRAGTGSSTRSAVAIWISRPNSMDRSYEAMATPSRKTVAKNGSLPACFSASRLGVIGPNEPPAVQAEPGREPRR